VANSISNPNPKRKRETGSQSRQEIGGTVQSLATSATTHKPTALESLGPRPLPFSALLLPALRAGRGSAPRSFTEWLTNEVNLPMDGGPHQGKRYQFRFQPITKHWANEIDRGYWNEFIYSGPSQSGKSFSGYVCPLLYHALELNQSVGFGVPMEEMADDKWRADIKPVMLSSPRLRRQLPQSGSGSAGGKIRDSVAFANGSVAKILTAGGSDQAKAGYTLRTILITEAARFSHAAATSSEADPLEQLRARQRSVPVEERRTYIDGTKTIADELPWSLWETSSRSRILTQCPHCGKWNAPTRANLLGWENARTEIEAMERASWHCPDCGEGIDNDDRLAALADSRILHGDQTIDKQGNVTGDLPRTRRLFFDYGAWHNAFLSAADLAKDLWDAHQIPEDSPARELQEKKLAQFVFGEIYRPKVEKYEEILAETDISDRRHKLPRGTTFADTAHLFAAIDVGEKFLHWGVAGLREIGTLAVIDYGTETLNRLVDVKQAIFSGLIDIMKNLLVGYTKDKASERMPIRSCYIDSGHLPEVVFAACKTINEHYAIDVFLPILGRGETQLERRRYNAPGKTSAIVRKIDPDGRWHESFVRRAKCRQLTLDADAYKRMSENGFRLPHDAPGAITLFSGTGNVHRVFSKHQINEQWLPELVDGITTHKWIQTGANHYKDVLAYLCCAANRHGFIPTKSE